MGAWEEPERRQSLVDIIASLGFQDRRATEGKPMAETSLGEGLSEDLGFIVFRDDGQPVVGTLAGHVTASQPPPPASVAGPREGVPSGSTQQPIVASPTEYEGVLATLQDVQHRAAEQRLAAERALDEARALESRIAEEAEHFRIATALAAKMQPLLEAAERAASHEQGLLDSVRAAQGNCAMLADGRERVESVRTGLLAAEKATTAEITRLEGLLAIVRSKLVDVTTAVASATTEFEMANSREEAAAEEAATKEQALANARQARAEAEARLQDLNKESVAIGGTVSTPHFEEQLRALEARIAGLSSSGAALTDVAPTLAPTPVVAMSELEKRIAARRAADAARGAAS